MIKISFTCDDIPQSERLRAVVKEFFEHDGALAPPPHMLTYSDMSKDDLLHAIQNELDREAKILEDLVMSCDRVGAESLHQKRDVGKLIAYQSISVWLHNVEKEHIKVKVI